MLLLAAALLASSPADLATAAWMQCLADQAAQFARSSESADIAADAAMGACAGQEGALVAAEHRHVSGAAAARLDQAERDGRALVRQRVISRVVELRTPR